MGLEEGRHFTVKMPEEGRYGYILIHEEGFGVRRLALCIRLWEAKGAGGGVHKLHTPEGEGGGRRCIQEGLEGLEEGKARGFLTLKGFEKEV
jgi:hypothetical protein